MKKNRKAFGLIETLIACAILIIIIGALMSLSVLISRNIAFTKQRATAFNLAQEGIEGIRQVRDTNLMDGKSETAWNTLICQTDSTFHVPDPIAEPANTYKLSFGAFGCYTVGGVTPKRITLQPVSATDGETISIGGIDFNRRITFEVPGIDPLVKNADTTSDNAIRVVVKINWIKDGQSREIELKELLTNWKLGL
jgi:type II secretory pathway pseudopilin PulG